MTNWLAFDLVDWKIVAEHCPLRAQLYKSEPRMRATGVWKGIIVCVASARLRWNRWKVSTEFRGRINDYFLETVNVKLTASKNYYRLLYFIFFGYFAVWHNSQQVHNWPMNCPFLVDLELQKSIYTFWHACSVAFFIFCENSHDYWGHNYYCMKLSVFMHRYFF